MSKSEQRSTDEKDTHGGGDARPDARDRAARIRHTTEFGEVFARELETLEKRREAVGLPTDDLHIEGSNEPAAARGIVGMAISGGGIRSSTFSLGVIQSLEEHDIFERVDYVSTVSGGGYTGSMLSSVLNEPERPDRDFPLAKPDGATEPPALQHVRNCANYLNPGGVLGGLRLPMIVIRGLVLNFLLFLPFIMLAVLATEVVHELGADLLYHVSTWSAVLAFVGRDDFFVFVLVPVIAIIYLLTATLASRTWAQRDRHEKRVTAVLLGVIITFLLIAMGMAVDWAIETPLYGEFGLFALLDQWWSENGLVTVGVIVAFAFAMYASARFAKVGKTVLTLVLSVLGPAGIFVFYLALCIAQLDSPFLDSRPLDDMRATAVADESGTHLRSTVNQDLMRALATKGVDYRGFETDIPASYCVDEGVWMLPVEGKLGCPLDALCSIDDDAVEASCGYRLQPRGDYAVLIGAQLRMGAEASDQTLLSDDIFAVLAILLLIINYFLIDVNFSSPHGFYRDRLSHLYLFRVRDEGERQVVEHGDGLKLTELCQAGSVAPYHLLNATINLQGNQAQSARGRQSDVFFFSKHFSGSTHTGFGDTATMEAWDPHLNLGTAMAISAAAASPNMGSMTFRPVVFIMTLLNVRLGYWTLNPSFLVRSRKPPRSRCKPGLRYLLREATGAVDARRLLVNVSDGGHLENLGAYELLRRRVRLLFVIDGEADPDMKFNGLVTLIRMARIDLGVDIRIDLDDLALDENRCSKAHFAIGRIHYGELDGEAEIGHLVYIKSSLVGDEDLVVRKYHAENPTFPHESTADQFFDEVQFEVYRLLGAHIAAQLVRDPTFVELID